MQNISNPVFCNFLDDTECKEGWLGVKGNCYFWSSEFNASNMETAHRYCVSQDSLLLSINDQEESTLITNVLQKLRQLKNIKAIWKMGLYDHFKTLSPQWSDGSLLSYRKFCVNVPSDPNCQCMTIGDGTWLWSDRYCDELTNFICESSKNVLGCGGMLTAEINSVYTLKNKEKMTLTLCFEACRAQGVALAAAAGDTCYCLENLPPSFVNLTWSQCSTRCAGHDYQLCGLDDPSNTTYTVAFVIKDVGQPLAKSCLDLEVQGITGSVFKVSQDGEVVLKNCSTQGIVCPTGSASINGRCYKYLTQIALSPQDICSSIFGSYVSVIDTEQEKEIHFGENNTITTSGRNVWTIGLFDHQQTGFVRTSSGRALKGLPIGVGNLTPEKGPCIAFDRSTNLFVSTSCTENPFICETGADFFGCAALSSNKVLVLDNYEEMSVTQCVELCRARGDTYALLGVLPFRCYCSLQKPISSQETCNKFCFYPVGQLCGGSNALSAYTIGEFPAFATSCEDLFAEGLLVPGKYLINNQSMWCTMKDNSTCSVDLSPDWLHVGLQEQCFHLSRSTELPTTISATCKNLQPSMVPASIRSEGEQTLLITLYKMLKDAGLKNPFRIGAMDQLEVGCFTWADGWLFDFAQWNTTYPNLQYRRSESSDKYSHVLFMNTGELMNFYTTLEERRVLCREITDYVGCYLKPTDLQAAVANYSSMSLTMCKQVCIGNTSNFAAVETESCYCLTSEPPRSNLVSTTGCDVPCPSNEFQSCAQPGYLRVYSLNYTDVATHCKVLYGNFVVLEGTYLLKNTTTGTTTPTTCGLSNSTTCPLGYIGYKEKCFRFFPSNKFAESATDHCVSVGGYLATPRTQGEIDFFVTVVKSIPSLSNLSMWRLGIVDLMNGQYMAASDGSLMALSDIWNTTTTNDRKIGPCSRLMVDSKSLLGSICAADDPYICETGPVFLGCGHVPQQSISFQVTLSVMSVQQCLTLCDAKDIRYAGLTSSVCACVSEDRINSTNISKTQCETRCTHSLSQNCGSGNPTGPFAIYDTGSYSYDDKTQVSCLRLRQYGVTAVGEYYLKAQNTSKIKVTCYNYGSRLKDILKTEASVMLYNASTNENISHNARLDVESVKWMSWVPDITDNSPWVQVTLPDYYLVKAVAISGSSVQGNSDYVTKFELQHGLLEDDLLTYSETFIGIESGISTDLVVRFLFEPVVAKVLRLNPLQWPDSRRPELVFTFLGELYKDFDHNQTYIGCFADPEKSLFSSYTVVSTAEACKNHCLAEGKPMYGLVLSDADTICACASEVGTYGLLGDDRCSYNCSVDEKCGSDAEASVAVHRTYSKSCPEPPVVGNASSKKTYLEYSPGVATFGLNVTYTCNEGYEFPDLSRNMTITCQQNNEWSQQPPDCQIVSCPPPQNMINSHLKYKDLFYGSNATYTCDKSHYIIGGKSLAVSTCSSAKTWTSALQCLYVRPNRKNYACLLARGQLITGSNLLEMWTRSRLECSVQCMTTDDCSFYSFSQNSTSSGINCKMHSDNSGIVAHSSWTIFAISPTSCS
ncbi:uncharacterized protein LOC112556450 [Pomacea canaliculata]|uniref:uncharacterized protein LOC112556450 n=1 Tax=Pomacea canaliculata TaxID=400727 RepID=UPI000D7314CA|nr:uncharacterized protein LOC112556450 [Pomacea canaliculata]XP_025081259.1 uncharacterized protein LOC112556450 [Pomacea canaliculata]